MDFTNSFAFYSITAIISLTLLYLLNTLRTSPRGPRLPPGPRPWPVIGNIHQLGKSPNESLFQLARIHGPLMTLRLGWRTTVVASSPAMARHVLKTQDPSLSARTVIDAATWLSYSDHSLVWSDCVPRWRTLRRICAAELFTAKRLEALHHLRRVQVSSMVRAIYKSKSSPVDIGHAAFLVSLNLLGNMIFSKDMFQWDKMEESQEFKEALTQMLVIGGKPSLADFFPFLRALDPRG